jgi:hypothetical protein
MNKSSTNGNPGQAASHSVHVTEDVDPTLDELAAKSGDPEFWKQKYYFYVEKLRLRPEKAKHWANGAVSASLEARIEFALAREQRLHVA